MWSLWLTGGVVNGTSLALFFPPYISGIDHHLLHYFVLHSLCGVLICDSVSFKFTCVRL